MKLLLHLASPAALATAGQLAQTSPRVEALVLGLHDLLEEESLGSASPNSAFSPEALNGLPTGIQLLGLLGARASPELLEAWGDQAGPRLLAAAQRARRLGFHGALTPHAAGVAACHAAFTEITTAGDGGVKAEGEAEMQQARQAQS